MRGYLSFGLTAALALAAVGCTRHVRLQVPQTSVGSRYICEPKAGCQPAGVDVPAERNPSGTVFVTLPKECGGHFNDILIYDADSSEPKVDVVCAPIEEDIEMQ